MSNRHGDSSLDATHKQSNDSNVGENTVGKWTSSDWKEFANWAGDGDARHIPKYELGKDGSITFLSSGESNDVGAKPSAKLAGAGDNASSPSGPRNVTAPDPYDSRELGPKEPPRPRNVTAPDPYDSRELGQKEPSKPRNVTAPDPYDSHELGWIRPNR